MPPCKVSFYDVSKIKASKKLLPLTDIIYDSQTDKTKN